MMTINYSKVSVSLIIFLIWNIVSPFFIEYNPTDTAGSGSDLYYILWIIWLLTSLFITILYLLDSKKNKKANALPPITSSGSHSKMADFLTSFMLGFGSLVLMHFILFITTDGFSLGTRGEVWFPGLAFLEIFFFLFVWIPAFFFILRKNISITKKVSKILIIFAITYLIIFIPQVVKHVMIQREEQQFYKENPALQKVLDQLKESKKKNQ